MIRDLYFGIAIILTVVAGMSVLYWRRAAPPRARAVSALLAALLVGGTMGFVWPKISQAMLEAQTREDNETWAGMRGEIVARYPDIGELMALSPPIEEMFKLSLVPIAQKYDTSTDRTLLLAGASRASKQAYIQYIFPVVVHGDNAALNAWGAAQLGLLQAVRAISVEACAAYSMTGVNHYSPDAGVDAALRDAAHAVVAAFKTSDAKQFGPPSAEATRVLFDKALSGATPPFTDADRPALGNLPHASHDAQCDLSIRLLQAIAKLDAADSASLYRVMMQTMAAPR
jgi:hypothetical protein